jgi:hypothetical protein
VNMQRLAQEFGSDWAQQHLVPHILAMAKNGNYLYRMTVLASLAQLAPHVSVDVCCNSMLPVVLAAAKDRCVRYPLRTLGLQAHRPRRLAGTSPLLPPHFLTGPEFGRLFARAALREPARLK